MTLKEGRVPPTGLFRVTGYDLYDYCDYWVGDYATLETAIHEAQSRALTANAVPSSFSDVFFVYDDLGVCRFRVTHDELPGETS